MVFRKRAETLRQMANEGHTDIVIYEIMHEVADMYDEEARFIEAILEVEKQFAASAKID